MNLPLNYRVAFAIGESICHIVHAADGDILLSRQVVHAFLENIVAEGAEVAKKGAEVAKKGVFSAQTPIR
jgi:hypothetical protein